jgi:anti-sigma B factor antagonist
MLEITTSEDGTIRLRGRFDASQVESAAAAFDGIHDSCTVDCAELSYISSAGLGLLFATQRRLVDAGKGLRLANLSPHIREVFRIAGFDRVFEIA